MTPQGLVKGLVKESQRTIRKVSKLGFPGGTVV